MARLDAIGAFALTEPDARLGLRRARDQRAPRRRRLGHRRRQALDRQRLDRRRRRRVGALGRGRPGQGLPRRDGHARATRRRRSTARAPSRAIWQADIRLDGVRVPDENRLPGREQLQGRRPRARHHARRTCAWARARPRRRRLRRRADLQQAAHAVRQAAVQLPDRPGPAREDARRGHRHAALLHAARPPRGGRAG